MKTCRFFNRNSLFIETKKVLRIGEVTDESKHTFGCQKKKKFLKFFRVSRKLNKTNSTPACSNL